MIFNLFEVVVSLMDVSCVEKMGDFAILVYEGFEP